MQSNEFNYSPFGEVPMARTLATVVFRQLRRDILSCRLLPGHKLKIADLAQQFDCAINVIREALTRLAAEGLVVARDQRGFTVAPLSRNDLVDLTETRIKIELLALQASIEQGDADWEDAVRTTTARLAATPLLDPAASGQPAMDWQRLHHDFHYGLLSACGSPRLLAMCRSFYEQSERFRAITLWKTRPGAQVEDEHCAIAEAVAGRQGALAAGLLSQHYTNTMNTVLLADKESGHQLLE